MKVLAKNSVVFHVEITEEEASMLLILIQNPLTSNDRKELSDFRRRLFQMLKDNGAAI